MKGVSIIGVGMLVMALVCCGVGCQGQAGSRRRGKLYDFPDLEAQWIRDGQPLEFEGQRWYPEDNVDIFLDTEVYPVGIYREVKIFVDKVDVRPYNRLYTKFGPNQFRSYRLRQHD